MGELTDCNFTARRDKSFAYDLVVEPGRVSGRVALLLRVAERKPVFADLLNTPISLPDDGADGRTPRGRRSLKGREMASEGD